MKQALEDIENKEYKQLYSIDLCALPPDLDELIETEEFDDDIIDDVNYVPKKYPKQKNLSVLIMNLKQ